MQDRDAWLAERRTGIGSSDIAAVCGLSEFGGPLSVYMDKLGLLPPADSPAMAWGRVLEDVVAAAFHVETGWGLTTAGCGVVRRHPDHHWMCCTPDRWQPECAAPVELKTARTATGWGPSGTDLVPEQYLIQVQWQMAACRADEGFVAVLIGGQDFRHYHLSHDAEITDRLVQIGEEFWGRVQRREPPDPDWSDRRTPALLDLLHRPRGGAAVALPAEAVAEAGQYLEMRAQAREAERLAGLAKARLVAMLGEASAGVLPDGRRVSRTVRHRRAYSVGAKEYTDFRITKGDGDDSDN